MPRKPTGMPNGRPKLTVNWEQVDQMCAFHCTGEEQAGILGMSYETLNNRCKEEKGMTFPQYFKQKSAKGKMSLRRRQFTTAINGNVTMQIWLGKNWLGQSDNSDESIIELEDYFVETDKKALDAPE